MFDLCLHLIFLFCGLLRIGLVLLIPCLLQWVEFLYGRLRSSWPATLYSRCRYCCIVGVGIDCIVGVGIAVSEVYVLLLGVGIAVL